MKHYVIIGNGVAAVGCIEGIRSIDTDGKITVISEEKQHVYCRPLISYYLENKTDLERIKYRPDDFYKKNGCTVIYGKTATKVSKGDKTVTLSDGKEIKYDSICIATGSSPFVPKIPGVDTVSKSFTFMTLDETLRLEKAINEDSRVLIVGAGLIGLKCAEGLSKRVRSITVCDLSERVLSSILDNECAAIMEEKLKENGINFMLSDTAEKFDKNTAYMKSGKTVEFDILIMAIGVRPNTSLAIECGTKVNRGILTDNKMKTSCKDIYAAGDCTESYDITCNGNRILAILPNAYMQGKCAGINMAGATATFDNSIPMNSIGFFGLHAMTAGSYYDKDKGGEMYEEKKDGKIKRLFTKDGYLTGFIIIGDVDRTGIYTRLIRERVPLSTLNFEMLREHPTLAAFGKAFRKEKLGGVV